MDERLFLNKKISRIILGSIAFLYIALVLACAETKPVPVSSWGGNFTFNYEPSTKKAVGSVPLNIAIVSPSLTELTKLTNEQEAVLHGLAKSMMIDLDKILISKGMTATGPFESLDLMTYPDKKNAELSLTPEIVVNVQIRDIGAWINHYEYFKKSAEVNVTTTIILIIREPLSTEKLWIKKIPLQPKTQKIELYASVEDLGIKPGHSYVHDYGPGQIQFDGSVDVLADYIYNNYNNIMETVSKYLDTQELMVLNQKAEEIRRSKRY